MSIRAQALPELLTAWNGLARALAGEGIQIGIADYGGFRTEADTLAIQRFRDADYAKYVAALKKANPHATPIPKTEWRKIAPYGASYHDFGAARDFTITQRPATMSLSGAVARVQALAPQYGLRSGASFGDPRHLELATKLADVAARWDAYAPTVNTSVGAAALPFLGGLAIVGFMVIVGRALYAHAGH